MTKLTGTTMRGLYQDSLRQSPTARKAAAMTTNWPISTPTLKPINRANQCPPEGLISPRTDAKPKPWSRPKKKMRVKRAPAGLSRTMFSTAAYTIDKAIKGSKNTVGRSTQPSQPRVSVTECATVKAVTCQIRSRAVCANKNRQSTNRM